MAIRRTSVGTQINRVIEDDRMPNSVQTGVLKSLLQEDGDIVEYIQEELTNSIGMRAERMYEYAQRGDYIFGLPSGKFITGADGSDALQAVLESIEGAPVLVDYVIYGPPNDLHIGWMNLMANQGYDPATNQLGVLTVAKGTPVYLDDMVVVVPTAQASTLQPESLQQWGVAARAGYTPERLTMTPATMLLVKPSPVESELTATAEYLRVNTIWKAGLVITKGSFTIPIAGFDPDAKYFHVRYLVGTTVKYWIYKAGSGTYPTLDAVFDAQYLEAGSFFPFIYFRFDKVSEISDKTTDTYKAGLEMTRRLNMDYDSVAEAIEANPDLDKIEQAMMMFMVPANTVDPLERRYLFTFFNNLYMSTEYGGQRYNSPTEAKLATIDSRWTQLVRPSVVIQDTRFKMSVDFLGVYKRRVGGSIGAVGAYDSGFVTTSTAQTVIDTITGASTVITTPSKYHYFREQISTGFYDEIQVVDLRTVFWILGDFKQATATDDSEILMIPLDRSITAAYSIPQREQLYARALHYVFNSAVVSYLKWYQTEAFSAVLIVIAIVITILSFGSQAWTIGVALADGAYLYAAYLILDIVIQYVILSLAFKLAVRVLGARLALVIAIIAAVAGVSGEMGAGGVAGAPWANQLLQLSSGLTTAISAKQKTDMNDLLDQEKSIQDQEAEQNKLIQTAKDLLDGNVHLDPFVIFGETPHDYYNRTVRSGNIGVLCIDAVNNYVEVALTLPTLQDTLGGY